MRVTARVNISLDQSQTYIPMGDWNAQTEYHLSEMGIPFVKRPAGTQLGYAVWALNTQSATKGTWVPAQWKLLESTQFLYMQQAYIDHLQARFVTAKILRTSVAGARTEIDSTGMRVYNSSGIMNIWIGNEGGYSILKYFSNDGNFLYDLGPNGISKIEIREEKWTAFSVISLGTNITTILNSTNRHKYKQSWNQTETIFYIYTSKIVAGLNQDPTNDGVIFTSMNKTGSKMPNGYYCRKNPVNMNMIWTDSTNTGSLINSILPDIHASNENVYDLSEICIMSLDYYTNGKYSSKYHAYWNETGGVI